jgi:hypothetical protein
MVPTVFFQQIDGSGFINGCQTLVFQREFVGRNVRTNAGNVSHELGHAIDGLRNVVGKRLAHNEQGLIGVALNMWIAFVSCCDYRHVLLLYLIYLRFCDDGLFIYT